MLITLDKERQTAQVKVLEHHPDIHDEIKDGVQDFHLQNELNGYLARFLEDMERNGYQPVDARLSEKELTEYGVKGYDNVTVYYNSEQKPFYTGYMQDSTGSITVFNNLDHSGEHGTIKEIAHIAPNRSIEYLESNIPPETIKIIEAKALELPEPPAGSLESPSSVEPEVEIMPDPAIGLSERDLYGYKAVEVLPLLKDRALEMFDTDFTVYLLYPDNTEAMAFEREEILNHDGIFGIEAAEWLASKEYAALVTDLSSGEAAKEAELISGVKNLYGIYQLKGGEETRDFRFSSFESLQKRGIGVDRSNYELVYTGELDIRNTLINLNKLYDTFNHNRPEDFSGHSPSISDVIVLQWRGIVTSHYVDRFGFEQLPSFLGVETLREQQQLTRYPSSQEKEQAIVETPEVISREREAPPIKPDVKAKPDNDRGSRKAKPKSSILVQVEQNKKNIAQRGAEKKSVPDRSGKEV
jgi:hypothetical protein